MDLALGIILLVSALILIVAVLLQNGNSEKLSGTITGGGSETYFGKNKGKSLDKKLSIITTVVAIIFVVLVLAVYIFQGYADVNGLIQKLFGSN